MILDASTVIVIVILIMLLSGIVGALIDIFIFRLDKYDQDDLKFQQWIDNYKKNNPKKKG